MENSNIAWTGNTHNFWTGCKYVSPGCTNCYMFAGMRRYGKDPEIVSRTSAAYWRTPFKWQKKLEAEGRHEFVFTCSWSDFFIQSADAWRPEAWDVIRQTPNLIWQILTKRPLLIPDRLPPDWGDGWPNVWLGTTIENRAFAMRAQQLARIRAVVRFISAEPLLEDIADVLDLTGIHWLIPGGESGPKFRFMEHQWVRNLLALARRNGTALFFKQSSGLLPETGRELDGVRIEEMPPHPLPTRADMPGGAGSLFC